MNDRARTDQLKNLHVCLYFHSKIRTNWDVKKGAGRITFNVPSRRHLDPWRTNMAKFAEVRHRDLATLPILRAPSIIPGAGYGN